MKETIADVKLIIKGISAFLIYFLISEFAAIPLYLLNIDITKLSLITKSIYTIITQLVIIFLIFLLFKDYIIVSIKDFKKNSQKYFKEYFKYWPLILVLMALSNGFITLIDPDSTANNQDAINELFKTMPVFTFILSVFLAPVIEEFAFRISFRHMFKNNYLFILFSGLLFGAFHVVGVAENYIDLLYIIPYSIPGWIFAYTLYKSNNIVVPISLHFLHNGLLMSLQVFLLIFGINI